MPTALAPAPGTLSFATHLSRIVTRLAAGLSVTEASIRICAAPDANMSEYLGEPGIVLRVRPPVPQPLSGGDRWAYFVDRAVDVFVVSLSLHDPGGRDDHAVYTHLDREEQVVDALQMQPPGSTVVIPVTAKWVPGGQEIFRQMKTDPGLLVSVLPFVVTYRARLTTSQEV